MATIKSGRVDETPTDVPLFLRKTYHMIDSCDPNIAGWSEDGETFVVKDPSKFEREIIPQFFKHSKFSSFVRQLNFYSFRKIKYVDTIRLDPELERETANFWRFHHEKFQRGKPHLLTEIKRANGHSKASPKAAKGNNGGDGNAQDGPPNQPSEVMKTELDSLKKRIEEMNKNMNELTTMVKKVSLDKKEEAATIDAHVPLGAKRKKTDGTVPSEAAMSSASALPSVNLAVVTSTVESGSVPPPPPSFEGMDNMEISSPPRSPPVRPLPPQLDDSLVQPDEMLSSVIDYEEVLPMDVTADDPLHLQTFVGDELRGKTTSQTNEEVLVQSSTSRTTNYSSDDALDGAESTMKDTTATTATSRVVGNAQTQQQQQQQSSFSTSRKRADPELMERLSEALAVLPKKIQEQIVERLIAAITTTDLFGSCGAGMVPANVVPHSNRSVGSNGGDDDDNNTNDGQEDEEILAMVTAEELSSEDESAVAAAPDVGMPLAAATLAALLSHYSAQIKKSQQRRRKSNAKENQSNGNNNKTIPVIPVHA